MNSLRIIHLNDLHSYLENFPVIERFFAERSEGKTDVFHYFIESFFLREIAAGELRKLEKLKEEKG